MGMKFCVLIIFLVLPWISRIGDWALKWTEGDEVLQVVFVMLVFPVIMNATQYYIIDSFIKNQTPDHDRLPSEDGEEDDDGEEHRTGAEYEDPVSGSSDEINSGDEDDDEVLAKVDEEVVKSKRGHSSGSKRGNRKETLKSGTKDYDPFLDGESSPTVVGSASTSERERLVLKETESEHENEQRRNAR